MSSLKSVFPENWISAPAREWAERLAWGWALVLTAAVLAAVRHPLAQGLAAGLPSAALWLGLSLALGLGGWLVSRRARIGPAAGFLAAYAFILVFAALWGTGVYLAKGRDHAAWSVALVRGIFLFLPALAGLGWIALRAAGMASWPGSLALPVGSALGMGLFGVLSFLAARFIHLQAGLWLPLGLGWAGLFLGRESLAKRARDLLLGADDWLGPIVNRILLSATAALSLFLLLPTLLPQIGWDAASAHLAVPLSWISAGRVANSPYLGAAPLPPMPYTLDLAALLAGAEEIGKLFQWLSLLGCAWAAMGLARLWAGTRAGCWAAAFFVAIPYGFVLMGEGLVDYLQAWLVAAGLLATLSSKDARAFIASGALFGMACLVKPQAGLYPVCLAAGLALAGPARMAGRGFWIQTAWTGLAMLAFSSPWWIPNLLGTGRLLGTAIFEHGFTVPAAGEHMLDRRPFSLAGLWAFLFEGARMAPHFGALFLALAPLGAAVVFRKGASVLAWLALAFLASFYMTGHDRWYLPLFPCLAALAAAGAFHQATAGRFRGWFSLPVLALQACMLLASNLSLPNFAWAMPYLRGSESRDSFLDRSVEVWRGLQVCNKAVPPDGRLLLYGESRVSYLKVPYAMADPLWSCPAFSPPPVTLETLEESCRRVGATHVFFNRRSPRSPNRNVEREKAEPAWKEMLRRHGTLLWADNGFFLFRLDLNGKPSPGTAARRKEALDAVFPGLAAGAGKKTRKI